ncbi:MAG: hypothetical protein IJX98_07520 [Clostridia bacterium]|nr:hypothetical protein [Clostridia bacterium]
MQCEETKVKKVTVKEMSQDILSMVKTCFEGKPQSLEQGIYIELPSGEKFVLVVKEVA